MDELLSAEQRQLRDSAGKLCADRGGAKRARALRDAGRDFDVEAWQAVRDAGWLGMLVPEDRGGLGLGAVELYIVLEQAGRQVLMTPHLETIAAGWLLAATQASSPVLPPLLAGERIVVPALDADGWAFRRAGTMRVPAFASSADDFVIETGQGLGLLPNRHDAVTTNVDGSHAGTLLATERATIIARDNEARALAAKLGDLLALGSAIELLGLCESAMTLALEHVKTRRQFGQPLGSFQALQHRLADNFVDLELNRSLLHRICLAWDAGTAVPAMIAAAKARAVRVAAEVMRNALQLHGAIGYTDEHDIGTLWKHALALSARYGNELTQAARFARLTAEET
ncbi:MAG TPA: acyl-CoA dehydrogenase family protein [Stellaceae bacterium]|jgi:alkylation response protein AidB-like acyl-CoA dehydrogenase